MAILDQHGKPIDTGTLKENQTASIMQLQHVWHEFNRVKGLTPERVNRLFQEAELGNLIGQAELFEDMLERDAHLYAEMEKRKSAPLNLEWAIVPPRNASPAEKDLAAYAQEVLLDMPQLEDIIKSLMDAVGHGFAALEMQWNLENGEWLPSFEYRPQSWFMIPIEDRTKIHLRDGSSDGVPLQPFSWVLHKHSISKTGYLGRSPLYRVLAFPFLYKLYGLGDFAEFLETYGLPIIFGKYPQGATEDQQRSLLRAVQALGHDARGVMPDDMRMEIETISSSSAALHLEMISYCDKAQSKAILGGTLSSQADGKTSTNALGTVHDEVRRDIAKSDCQQIAGTITRDIIYPILMLNKGGVTGLRRCPRFVFDTSEAENLGIYADSLPKLVNVGLHIPASFVYDKLKIPVPQDSEVCLIAPSAPLPQAALSDQRPARFLKPRRSNFTAEQQVIENGVNKLLNEAKSPITANDMRTAIMGAKSPEDLADRLAVLMDSDSTEFEQVLANAMFAADVLGYAHAN